MRTLEATRVGRGRPDARPEGARRRRRRALAVRPGPRPGYGADRPRLPPRPPHAMLGPLSRGTSPQRRNPRRIALVVVAALVVALVVGELVSDIVNSAAPAARRADRSWVAAVIPVVASSTSLESTLVELRRLDGLPACGTTGCARRAFDAELAALEGGTSADLAALAGVSLDPPTARDRELLEGVLTARRAGVEKLASAATLLVSSPPAHPILARAQVLLVAASAELRDRGRRLPPLRRRAPAPEGLPASRRLDVDPYPGVLVSRHGHADRPRIAARSSLRSRRTLRDPRRLDEPAGAAHRRRRGGDDDDLDDDLHDDDVDHDDDDEPAGQLVDDLHLDDDLDDDDLDDDPRDDDDLADPAGPVDLGPRADEAPRRRGRPRERRQPRRERRLDRRHPHRAGGIRSVSTAHPPPRPPGARIGALPRLCERVRHEGGELHAERRCERTRLERRERPRAPAHRLLSWAQGSSEGGAAATCR